MKQISYNEAEERMRVGDVIAFGGSSHFSGIIKLAIRAEVSHIGIIIREQHLIDSTSRRGVAVSKIIDRFNEYDGEDFVAVAARRSWSSRR